MDLGLYNLKYPARRLIQGVLPQLRDTDPNHVSLAMLPVGALTALAYAMGARGQPWLYLVGIALIFLRMFLGTLDGLVATHYGKETPAGQMMNRLAPEVCDALLLVALALARPEWTLPGTLALAMAWLVTFAGLLGATSALPTQSVGPTGQTDRLAALQVLSLLAFLAETRGWTVDFIALFLWWVALASPVTVALRLMRHFKAASPSP